MKKKKINIIEYKELGFTVIKNIVPKKNLQEIMFSLLSNTKKYSKISKLNTNNDLDNLLYQLIKKIKRKLVKKQDLKVLISLSMYQFTRPFNQDESQIYQETLRNGRHKTLNSFLKNCISLI